MYGDKDRFIRYIEKLSSGCWEWQSTIKKDGYGQFWYKGSGRRAHRVAYELFIGRVPSGKLVLHKCDNCLCVNPEHLYIGTQKDNVKDMIDRGRFVGHRTLNKSSVERIRKLYKGGNITQWELADMFGVNQPAIWKIVNYKTWKTI